MHLSSYIGRDKWKHADSFIEVSSMKINLKFYSLSLSQFIFKYITLLNISFMQNN